MPATKDDVPRFYELMNPTLEAIRELGGSASIGELEDEIISSMDLPNEIAEVLHGSGNETEIGYRAAWARTYLKKCGYIDNSQRGIWTLTSLGMETQEVNPQDIVREVERMRHGRRDTSSSDEDELPDEDEISWQDELLSALYDMEPDAFERLCQRILRESGFIEVEVTRHSGDGGIDGYGTIRLGGLISFNVIFQSKRYRGSIGPDIVRDFRGAMVGRADKGLLITTGRFTREARKEAIRDGAPPIDLIDGELLVEKLKELRLGVSVEMVEEVEIDKNWFTAV